MFKTQEFAKLCDTTKETLFHYDRLDLLKPDQIMKNGYRMYSYKKLSNFKFLSFLKDSGCSLKDVESVMNDGISKKNVSVLDDRAEKISEQIKRLKKEKLFFEAFKEELEADLKLKLHELIFTKLSKQSFALVDVEPQEIERELDLDEKLRTAFPEGFDVPPVGVCLDNEALAEGKWVITGYLFVKDTVKTSSQLKVKKGDFALWQGRGGIAEKRKEGKLFIESIQKSLMTIEGDVMCITMLGLLDQAKINKPYFKLMVPVE